MSDERPAPRPVPPWYRNLVLVTGIALIAVGLGNWVTGTIRMREHAGVAARTPVAVERPREVEAALRAELDVAQMRIDFYHVFASLGRLLTAAGIVVTAFGLARSLRPEARRKSDRR